MDLFYSQTSAGQPILKYSVPFSFTDSGTLNTVPFNIIAGIPPLKFGIIPIMILFSGSVDTQPNVNTIYIGNPTLLSINTSFSYSSFTLDLIAPGDTFNLMLGQNPDLGTTQGPNAVRDYIPNPLNAPGTDTLQVWQNFNETASRWGGVFTTYYLDQPLY